MQTYRFPASDIEGLEGAWANTDLQCDKGVEDYLSDSDATNDNAAAIN